MSNNNMKNADMPAMPQPMVMDEDGNTYTTFDNYHGEQAGLTKREMFAMNAMQGLISRGAWSNQVSSIANDAVRYADALLAELEKVNEN